MIRTEDQASDLRTLARQSLRRGWSGGHAAARAVLVAAGKTRAGSTTVALQLAVAAARDGQRVVLLDLDSQGGDIAERMQIEAEKNINDVLHNEVELTQTLVKASQGIHVAPGPAGPMGYVNGFAIERFERSFRLLTRRSDLVVIDAGSKIESLQQVFWHQADAVLMVSTPDSLSVLDSYAMLKTNHAWDLGNVGVLINQSSSWENARDVFGRVRQACHQFLKTDIAWRGWLPYSSALAGEGRETCDPQVADESVSLTFETLASTYRFALGQERKQA